MNPIFELQIPIPGHADGFPEHAEAVQKVEDASRRVEAPSGICHKLISWPVRLQGDTTFDVSATFKV